jgi:hypothetical protein
MNDGRWPMTREECADRLVEIEHRLAWIERRLGAPMSVVDHIIAAAAEKQWRQQRRRRAVSLRRQRLLAKGKPRPANAGRRQGVRNKKTLAAAARPDALAHLAKIMTSTDPHIGVRRLADARAPGP